MLLLRWLYRPDPNFMFFLGYQICVNSLFGLFELMERKEGKIIVPDFPHMVFSILQQT
jgi:hypothetical protein